MILEELATRLAWVLIHSLWQGTLVGIVALILFKLIRGAAARHVLGIGAMLLILAMAIHQFGKPGIKTPEPAAQVPPSSNVSILAIEDVPPPTSLPALPEEGVANAPSIQTPFAVLPSPSPEQAPPISESKLPFNFLPWLSALWLVGVVALIFRHLGGWWLLRRWRSKGISPIPVALKSRVAQIADRLRLTREVPLFLSDRVAMPLLVGVIKPVILLPASLVSGIRPAELDALIAHELAHLRRRDSWANHLQIVIETFLFFHPAIWILGRMTRRERENAADDLALESGLDQKTYAVALASVAELSAKKGSLALAANDGPMLTRIRRVLLPGKTRSLSPAAGWLGTLALTLTAGFFFLSSPETSAEEKVKEAPSEIIKVKEGESIQEAIDKAKPNSIIEIGEGTFRESLTINKPLTLKGAGWEKTVISPEREQKNRDKGHYMVFIEKAKGCSLKDLKVTMKVVNDPPDVARGFSLMAIYESDVSIKNCAIVGPAGNGIVVARGSTMKMEESLVAGLWKTGISCFGNHLPKSPYEASQIEVINSVIRSCYSRGISLGPGCDQSKIVGSWISGAAWHGIEYTSASPLIERNLISGTAQGGIHAQGETKAIVRKNAFIDTEGPGFICKFQNEDLIEDNLFRQGGSHAIWILGSGKPKVMGNSFIQKSGTSIACFKYDKDPVFGSPELIENRFIGSAMPFAKGQDELPFPAGNVQKDWNPGDGALAELNDLVWPNGPLAQGDIVLSEDDEKNWPRLRVASKLWPRLLPEEEQIVPEGASRRDNLWKANKNQEEIRKDRIRRAFKKAQPWITDAFQLDDVAKKEKAIKEMLTAINSEEAFIQLAGLTAFTSSGEVRFEKGPFHDPAVSLLGSSDPEVRAKAATALLLSGIQEGDLDRLLKLTRDVEPRVRLAGAGTLIWALKKDLTEEPYAKRIAELLEDESVRKEILRSLWGVKISPEIEAAVLKISNTTKVSEANTNDSSYDALYYALSTQPTKSEAVVRRLIEYLAARDTHNIAGRAAWGLGYGVATEQQDLVVKGALKLMAARQSSSYAFRQCLARVKQYAAKDHLPGIRELLKKPGVEGDLQKDFKALVDRLEK